MKSFPVLHTNRCILTEVTHADIQMLREILDDADSRRFLPELCEQFQTEESLQQFITSFDNYLAHDEGVLWGIRLNKATPLIGFIAIMDMPENPTLFYTMHSNYRNNGYMTEVIASIQAFVNDVIFCSHIQTEVLRYNVVSQRVLTNNSFQQYKMDGIKIYYRYETNN